MTTKRGMPKPIWPFLVKVQKPIDSVVTEKKELMM